MNIRTREQMLVAARHLVQQLESPTERCEWNETLSHLNALALQVSSRPRPYLDHVGIVVRDLRKAATTFGELLGGRVVAGGTEAESQVRSVFIEYPGGGKVELLQPIGEGPMQTFLEKHGEGVHHLTLVVDDVIALTSELLDTHLETTGLSTTEPNWHEVYLRPKTANGCLVQLVRVDELYGEPTAEISLESVLADEWEWKNRSPQKTIIG